MIRHSLSFVFATFLCLEYTFAGPLEDEFPKAFKGPTGIKVHPKTMGGVEGYEIEEFPPEEKNRNHFDERGTSPISHLVMHYTVGEFPSVIGHFTSNETSGRVSAHYVVTQKEEDHGILGGIPVQVVPEEMRSWHAGVSFWRDVKNLNPSSIGIENVNQGFVEDSLGKRTWFPFDPDQIKTLGLLSQDIVQRHRILPQNVVGHDDIAPGRKFDPGILFPWGELYETYGVGAGLSEKERNPSFISTQYLSKEPLPKGTSEAFFLQALREYGYECPEGAIITPEHHGVVKTFKAHFSRNGHPEAYTSEIDETEMLWAYGLVAKYSRAH